VGRCKLEPWADLIFEAHFAYWRNLAEIANHFRTSKSAVRTLFRIFDVETTPSSATDDEVRAHRARWCQKLGLKGHPERAVRYSKEWVDSIISDYAHRRSMDEIALLHGCAAMTVLRTLRENNIKTRPRGRQKKLRSTQNGLFKQAVQPDPVPSGLEL